LGGGAFGVVFIGLLWVVEFGKVGFFTCVWVCRLDSICRCLGVMGCVYWGGRYLEFLGALGLMPVFLLFVGFFGDSFILGGVLVRVFRFGVY